MVGVVGVSGGGCEWWVARALPLLFWSCCLLCATVAHAVLVQ